MKINQMKKMNSSKDFILLKQLMSVKHELAKITSP